MADDKIEQWEADASVALLGTALIAHQIGYRGLTEVAIAAVLLGVSGPRLWRHHVRGERLPATGGHWISVGIGIAILALLLMGAPILPARGF